jgi:hypothetical protein
MYALRGSKESTSSLHGEQPRGILSVKGVCPKR